MAANESHNSVGFLKPFLAVGCISIPIHLLLGAMFGQSAGMLPQLMSSNSTIHIIKEEATWIASMSLLGSILSTCICGTFSDMFGRVRACQLSYLFYAIGFGMISAAKRVMVLLVGRFFIGFGTGFSFPAMVYTAEIAPQAYRSVLLSIAPLMSSVGLIYMYIVGGYLPWYLGSAMTFFLSIIGLCLTLSCYDSAPYLVRKNDIEGARKSLQRIEHPSNVEAKLKELEDIAASQAQDKEEPIGFETLMDSTVWKPFLMMATISLLTNCSGFYIIVHYAVNFMREFRLTYDPLQVSVAIGVVRLLSTIISSYLLRILGRRTIGAISGFSSAALLCLIFVYLSFEKTYSFLSESPWIPVSLFLAFMLTMTLGIFSLPVVMPYEVFPIRVRGAMCGACCTLLFVFTFCFVKLYYVLIVNLGLKGLILFFASGSMAFGIFSVTYLVETHKKTLDEIQREFLSKEEYQLEEIKT